MIKAQPLRFPLPDGTSAANDSADDAPVTLQLPDGSVASVVDRALEVRDMKGRLMVRYIDGTAEIAAPEGDLVLTAPQGRVVVRSALDVEIEAARDLRQTAGRAVHTATSGSEINVGPRSIDIQSEKLSAQSEKVELALGVVSTVAKSLATKADSVSVTAAKYELAATRLIERSKDTFREVSDLAQTRVGRARTIVTSLFTLSARRTVLTSKEETSIDGRKILLG